MEGLGIWDGQLPDAWRRVEGHGLFDLVRTGVGKANASGAVARVLDPADHGAVISAGIAGALPQGPQGPSGPDCRLGEVVCATRSLFGDEGVGTPDGFITLSELGLGCFPDGSMGATHDPDLVERLGPVCDRRGAIATVSWCSGTDACARAVVSRCGAIAEAMEGAAVCLSALRVSPGIATGEIRVISNTTGDRHAQRWALDESLAVLGDVLGHAARCLA